MIQLATYVFMHVRASLVPHVYVTVPVCLCVCACACVWVLVCGCSYSLLTRLSEARQAAKTAGLCVLLCVRICTFHTDMEYIYSCD